MSITIDMDTVGLADPVCPKCLCTFTQKRKNQRYCSRPCQKSATNNAARGSRDRENTLRNDAHYGRAAWLAYDLYRMSPTKRRAMLLAILEAASNNDGALRNILFDPALLGADRGSPVGKLYPDAKSPRVLNVAKMVNVFCMIEFGCSSRSAVLDKRKPAGRKFVHDGDVPIRPPHIYERPPEFPHEGHGDRKPAHTRTVDFYRWLTAHRAERPLSTPRTAPDRLDMEDDFERVDRIVTETQERVSKLPVISAPEEQPEMKTALPQSGYDWRRIARAMGDRGWRRYYSLEEADLYM